MADVRELSTDPAVKPSGASALTTDNATVVALSPNSPTPAGGNLIGAVTRAGTQVDVHGQTLGVSRVVQVTAKFFQQPPASFLNITASGGATATGPTGGMAVFATSTAVTASLLAQTPVTVMYATQFEAWASMAGAFTTPTSAASFQRLGIYDAANGYFFGYSGLTFGLTTRVGTVDAFTAKASWNVDTLTGVVGSKFTSGGAPVALAPTNMNMWRIRYGWYGAVTARYEVYSPDGEWVLVHQVRTANTQTGVNITAPDLPMTVEVNKAAADATDLKISCGGWGAGITSPSAGPSLSGQGSIAALNATVVVPVTGVGTLSFSISNTWVGTLSFQYSVDGIGWTADAALSNVTGLFPSAITANGAFTATVGSYKFYRIVATAWTSGSASVVYNTSSIASMVVAQSIITDGLGNGPVAVKAASTAAVAADPALVVTMSPNSTASVAGTRPNSGVGVVAGSLHLTVGGSDGTNLRPMSVDLTGRLNANAVLAAETTKVIGTTPGPALTKGTQGTVGHSTQDLKDAGRVAVSFTTEFSPIAVAEAMLSVNVSKDGATAAATTSYVVTTGKRLRITSISHFVETTLGTSIQRAYLRMRFAATGGAVVTSPLQMSIPVAAAGVVKSISTLFEDIPDGLEFLGDGTRAIGFSLQAPDWVTAAATLKVYVTVIGFEY